MSRFHRCLEPTLEHEQYYANEGWDDGKETYRGISRKHNPDWPGWAIIDAYKEVHGPLKWNTKIPGDTLERLVEQRYYEKYWTTIKGDQIRGEALAALLFDFHVQSGFNAVRELQRAINLLGCNPPLRIDGGLGRLTLAASNRCDQSRLHDLLKLLRKEYLQDWAKRKRKPDRVLAAVLRRVDAFPNQYTT